MNEWILKNKLNIPGGANLQKIIDNIKGNSKLKIDLNRYLVPILRIVYKFANNPWLTQEEILSDIKISKEELISINNFIRENKYLQNLIIKEGTAYKYWQSISPFCKNLKNSLNNEFSYPMRIAFYPGVSCMYYCGFCGRNQDAKYPLNTVDQGLEMFKRVITELDPANTAISISGGLEPLTNPKIGEIIEFSSNHGLRVPLITNGHSLTENNLKKHPGLKKLDSIRISLYGVDEKSYEFITTIKKSYKIVKKNCINFLKFRNDVNPKIKFGVNYIILKENIDDIPKLIDFISEVNSEVNNGPGINFLSLRDDFDTVTGISDKSDAKRKYHLSGLLSHKDREKLTRVFNDLENSNISNELHIDYGYALYSCKNGMTSNQLKKVSDNEMRKYGHTQMSVCIDLFGDVFLYREAGFLNRNGNEKFIIGRLNKNNSLKSIIKNFLNSSDGIKEGINDVRFMDPFDHVLTSLINQAEKDLKFGVPFENGPVLIRSNPKKINLGNSWYENA